ncbi:hypothetical protein EAH78_05900 [Pseudomonas arsenicoxydans]|uniref:Uncharacterized protein n=1 Tax=Pseudomonas arsenicoxydans TaxID=702115 RepID=A0A502I3S6_9PSED|nr:hypothetical protein EAH78_05900 [Pseudomonas arsenicoxydans]
MLLVTSLILIVPLYCVGIYTSSVLLAFGILLVTVISLGAVYGVGQSLIRSSFESTTLISNVWMMSECYEFALPEPLVL